MTIKCGIFCVLSQKKKQRIIYKYKYLLWVAGASEITLQLFSPVAETSVNYVFKLNFLTENLSREEI